MDTVHYNNQHFILRGVDRNRYIGTTNSSGTTTTPGSSTIFLHGMLANTAAPTADATAGTGITLSSGSTLTYWVEERVKEGSTIIRRNATTSTETVTVTGTVTNKDITITRPTAVNSDATHWALYSTATNGAFPTGAEISEVVIATTTITDTRSGTDPTLPSGDDYEVVTVSIAGISSSVSRNGPPPVASTGDIFEDSLVLNDADNTSLIWYSFPDTPHAFPSIQFIRFETKEQDEVRLIRALGQSLGVVLRDSLWRVNILPRPEDSAFEIERVKAQIDGAFGTVGPMAGDTFSWGQGPRLAYVSPYGIVVTDLYVWDTLTDDLDWENTVEVSLLSQCVLRNNPRRYRLEFYYTPKGGTKNTKALYLHYHPSHAKEASNGNFRAKITGPINVPGNAVTAANLGGTRRMFTADNAGFVYLEESGNSDESDYGGIAYVCRTGERYLNGLGGDAKFIRMWAHHSAGATGQTATCRLLAHEEGRDADEDTDTDISLERREPTSTHLQLQGESHQFGFENSDTAGSFGLNYFIVDWEGTGRTEADGS